MPAFEITKERETLFYKESSWINAKVLKMATKEKFNFYGLSSLILNQRSKSIFLLRQVTLSYLVFLLASGQKKC